MRFLAIICLVAIAALSLVPGDIRPDTGLPKEAEHFLAYAGMGLCVGLAFRTFKQRLTIWIAVSIASGLFEVAQRFIPGRTPHFLDSVASISGLSVGLVIGAVILNAFFSR